MEPTTDLVVDSVTGVDVALPVAGPGVRSYAFLIDWHIRAVISLAWYVVAAVLYSRSWHLSAPISPDSSWFSFVIAPAAAIYFLYHPVVEILTRGQTPGKRIAGVQTVNKAGEPPTVAAILTRNVFRLIDSFPVAYAFGLTATACTRNHVRIGDLAAGTLLVYVQKDAMLPPTSAAVSDPDTAEIVAELLQRWPTLARDARRRLALEILAKLNPALSGDARASAIDIAADDDGVLREQLERHL